MGIEDDFGGFESAVADAAGRGTEEAIGFIQDLAPSQQQTFFDAARGQNPAGNYSLGRLPDAPIAHPYGAPPPASGGLMDFLIPSTPLELLGIPLTLASFGGYPAAVYGSRALTAYNIGSKLANKDSSGRDSFENQMGINPMSTLTPVKSKAEEDREMEGGDPNFGGGGEDRPFINQPIQVAEVNEQAVEEAASGMPSYESYFMGYDPSYDPYSAGFTAQPELFGRREVVAESGGGVMNLQKQANQLAAQGRGGDTMLMHMRPDEVAGLASLGGVTRNPTTGLPEGFLLPALGAFAPGLLGLGGSTILGSALATGLGAGAGQALQSKILGEEDPLKKGMVAGLTAGLGSAALGGFGQAFGGEVGGASNALTSQTAKELGTTEALKAGQRAGKMFPEVGSFANMDSKLMGAGDAAREALTVNPLTTAGVLGGVGGAASDAYAMQNVGSMMPGEGTSGKSFREPQTAVPKTPRERTGLAQSGDLTSYGFRPEGLFFGEGVYAEDGGRPVARMDSGGFMRDLMYSKPLMASRVTPRSPFGGQSEGVQGSVSEATQNLGEAGQALQSASDQVQRAQGTLNPNMRRGGFGGSMLGGLANLFGEFGGSRQQQMQQQQQQLDAERAAYMDQRRMMEEGGIASMPEGSGDEMQLKITQDAVDAVRGEHPEPEIAIESFISFFGPEAFESLRRLVIQEESARTMGKADGLVNGDDGGRDDIQRGTIDGDQELNISGGEYIFSADDVALLGDGNTEAGARRLDEARDNLRKSARGTTKRPAYMGEGAAEEMFEEVMTG